MITENLQKNFLEEVTCDLCGSADYKIIYPSLYRDEDLAKDLSHSFLYAAGDRARGNIVRCRHCGLVYATPRDKNVAAIYENSADDNFYLRTGAERKEAFVCLLDELEVISGLAEKRGKLLDVGCGYGFFLDIAKERGWEEYGCELGRNQSSFAAKNHSRVFNKELSDCGFPENFFDAIALYDVLEHLTSPSAFIKIIRKILKTEGWLVINMPNFSSWSSKIMGRFWHGLARMHLYYFTPKTIRKFLSENNFKIVKITPHKMVIRLGAVVEWAKKFPAMYKLLNFLFNNRFLGNIKIKTSFGGNNMIIYARKG